MQKDRQDSSAVGWDYQEKLHQHDSQKGMGPCKKSFVESQVLIHTSALFWLCASGANVVIGVFCIITVLLKQIGFAFGVNMSA